VEGEDIFFALSTNSLKDETGGKFYVQVNVIMKKTDVVKG
jgi:hypothetical protein